MQRELVDLVQSGCGIVSATNQNEPRHGVSAVRVQIVEVTRLKAASFCPATVHVPLQLYVETSSAMQVANTRAKWRGIRYTPDSILFRPFTKYSTLRALLRF